MPALYGTGITGGGSQLYPTPIEALMAMFPSATGAATPTTGTATGTLPGATPRGYTSASGGVPAVPDPQAAQAKAVAGNVANLPAITGMASGVNQFNLGEVLKQYQAGVPGWSGLSAQSSQNIGSALRGEVPSDVLNLIGQRGAERGIATGLPGSPNANAAYLRALGLTSLGQQQYGEQALTGAVARMPRTGLYDVSKDFISPSEQEQLEYMANVLAAAPIPQDAYNQAIMAAQMGQRYGFNSARTPMQPTIPGMTGGTGTSAVLEILNKYAATQPAVPSSAAQSSPGVSQYGGSIIEDLPMSDEDWAYYNFTGEEPY